MSQSQTLFVPPLRIKVTGKSDTGAGRPREIISTVHLPIMRWGEVSIEKQPRLLTEDRGDGDEVETRTAGRERSGARRRRRRLRWDGVVAVGIREYEVGGRSGVGVLVFARMICSPGISDSPH